MSIGKPCKLCGMKTRKPALYRGFSFCCNKCIDDFINIMARLPQDKRTELMEKDIVI